MLISTHASGQPDSRAKARALELFQESDRHYKRGEFERAVELLREAHALYPEPILVYNLARALEGLGDLPGAIEQYERYLREAPQIEDRGAIERRIATLKEQLAVRERAAQPTGGGTEPTPTTTGPTANRPDPGSPSAGPASTPGANLGLDRRGDEASARPRSLPWIIAGAGVGVVAVGGVFGYLSQARQGDAEDEPVQVEAVKLHDAARRDATIANVMFVTGGAIAIGGAVWGVLERRKDRARPTIAGAHVEVAPAWVGLRWELP